MRPDKNLVKKSITIDPELADKVEALRTKERPIPSFSTVLSRLAWKGLGKRARKAVRKRAKKKEEEESIQ